MRSESLKTNFFWLFICRGISLGLSFLTWALLNRALGPENRGIIGEIQTWIGFFVVAFGFGLDNAIYHFTNKERYGDDDSSRLVTILVLLAFYAFLGALVLGGMSLFTPAQFSVTMLKHIGLVCALFTLQIFNNQLLTFIQALGAIKFAAVQYIVLAIVNGLVIGYGYLAGKISIFYVLISLIVFQLAALLLIISFLARMKLFKGKFSFSLARKMLMMGLKQYIATVCTFIYTKINQLLVLRYCGPREAGWFTFSLNLAFSLLFVPATLQTALYPRVIHAHDEYEVTIKTLRVSFYTWGAFVLLVILLAWPILFFYGGNDYLPAINIFRLHMLAVWFLPLSSFTAPYYVKLGAFLKASSTAVLLSIISVTLNILLIPRLTSIGAALATALTCLIGFMISLAFFYYLSRKRVWSMFYPNFKSEIAYLKQKLNELTGKLKA